MLEIFRHHHNWAQKGRDYARLRVKEFAACQSQATNKKAFFVEKNSGEFEDISYIKSIENLMCSAQRLEGALYVNTLQRSENERLVVLLLKLNQTFPLQQQFLLSALRENYPHIAKGERHHLLYLSAVLQLVEGQPALARPLLMLILETISQLDAQIKLGQEDPTAQKLDLLMRRVLEFLQAQY
jgi:hypothetical protein